MKAGHVRVPHGWWFPELTNRNCLGGAFIASDAMLSSDSEEYLDREQGVPHFKGFPGRLRRAEQPRELIAASDEASAG